MTIKVTIGDKNIKYGLSDGFTSYGMYVAPCPGCGLWMRDWGTTGDFSGHLSQTWRCWSESDCGCFDEAVTDEVYSARQKTQMRAVEERVQLDPESSKRPSCLAKKLKLFIPCNTDRSHGGRDDQHVN